MPTVDNIITDIAAGLRPVPMTENCVITTAVREDLGYNYLCVAMNCPEYTESGETNVHGEMIDSKNLYEWAFNNLSLKSVMEAGSIVGEVGLEYAWDKDTVQVQAADGFHHFARFGGFRQHCGDHRPTGQY